MRSRAARARTFLVEVRVRCCGLPTTDRLCVCFEGAISLHNSLSANGTIGKESIPAFLYVQNQRRYAVDGLASVLAEVTRAGGELTASGTMSLFLEAQGGREQCYANLPLQ